MIKKVTGNEPEQIHLSQSVDPTAMYVSWTTGDGSYTFCGDGDTNGNATENCFFNLPKAVDSGTVVHYSANHYKLFKNPIIAKHGQSYNTTQYVQIYGPIGAGANYTSPIIHHAKMTNLVPDTTYYYRVGDGKTFSRVLSFKTLPAPGTNPRPLRLAITADLGTTHATVEVLQRFTEGNKPDMVLLAGDHCYADNHQNDQRYWDAWFRLLENSTSEVPWQVNAGNHEEETQWTECIVQAFAKNASCGTADYIRANCPSTTALCPCQDDRFRGEKGSINPDFVWNNCPNDAAFKSFNSRWATPYLEAGSTSNKYFTWKAGLVQGIVLSGYEPYCGGSLPCSVYHPNLNVGPSGTSAQYKWLAETLAKINRTESPWVIVYFHNPWYTTWGGFKTDDCVRQALEPILKEANVDLFYTGHIHAYERSNPVFKFLTSEKECNPVHIVVGDGGNDETLNCALIDRGLTATGKLNCVGQQLARGSSEGYYFPCTSHTFQDSPEVCMKNDSRVDTSFLPPSYFGCQEDGYCPNKQPLWSAYRAAAYGSGLLEITNATHATWTWRGFFKTEPTGILDTGAEVNADEVVTFVKC